MEIPRNARVFVAGHRGLVGSALWRELHRRGFTNIIGRSRDELDLLNTDDVRKFFQQERPDYVFVAAARVGGIEANRTRPADFLVENLAIQNNLICSAHQFRTRKLLFLGSSCIYPRDAAQPLREDALLSGPLEATNEAYAIAKIAGIKLCQAFRRQHGCDFISAMPTNIYGPHDNYDLASAHVLPALLRRFHEAKITGASEVVCWGSGRPRREFLHADDLASACLLLMERYSHEDIINVGYGTDLPILDLAEMVRRVVGFRGTIRWDTSKPDGTPRKLLDTSRLSALGWIPRIGLEEGIASVYQDLQEGRARATEGLGEARARPSWRS
jgi:GDP-L-fucose synthase